MRLVFGLLVERIDVESAVVNDASAEYPTALRRACIMRYLDNRPAAALAHLIALGGAFFSNQVAAPRGLHELVHQIDLAHIHRNAVHPDDALVGGYIGLVPGAPAGSVGLDQGVVDASGMFERNTLLTETLERRVFDTMGAEPLGPKIRSAGRNCQHDALNLIVAQLAFHPGVAHRKGGDDGSRITIGIAVIEIVDRYFAVIKKGFLDAAKSENLGMKFVVLLLVADAQSYVV